MQKLYIVITKDGFLTSKKENNIIESDTVLSEAKDEYLRDRITDIADVGKRVLRNLSGSKNKGLDQLDEKFTEITRINLMKKLLLIVLVFLLYGCNAQKNHNKNYGKMKNKQIKVKHK